MVSSMTLEELKSEANKLGYNLVKKREYIKFLPCTCGCNRREHWVRSYIDSDEIKVLLVCAKCGREVDGKNLDAAKRAWNESVSVMKGLNNE